MNPKKDISVLIAEDDFLISETIRQTIESLGYVVVGEAMDGREALEMTCNLHPDVVLMDIKMPTMNGIEATHHIQASCPTPVVALTAHDAPELVDQAGEAGASAYLVKMPERGEIKRAITIAIERFKDLMELRRLNQELQDEIARRKQAEKTLREHAIELEKRNEDLDAFADAVSHDLKNPLNLVMGFADVLSTDYEELPLDTIQTTLQMIVRKSHEMNSIIDALLLLARVRKEDIVQQPLNMASITKQVIHRLDNMIQDHQAHVTLPDEEDWPTAIGYRPWVEEVWVNYLSNAIKYGGDPDKDIPPLIELGFDRQTEVDTSPDSHIRFWVRDNGPGLTPDDQDRLFTPFTRLDQDRSYGNGLGLSIVRRIMDKMGGETGVESTVDEGSTFWFTLPAQK